ncbi:OST3 / OST6 family protein [Ancylostoma duodenale]|uniref:OST3 / OST6 family protein n=1 Tax=Ancylostoma duodenale TaxID=51022 RepID=A0A0C2G172_9BILA|nr:OST3 / OST6 family protein [Ancylostoma duodenale]
MTANRLGIAALFLAVLALAYAAQPTSLDEKVKALQDLLYRQPAVRMNMDRWKTFVRQQPRNYSMIIMFTALSPGVNCPICKPAYDEFMIMANSYRYAHSELKQVYFGVVDYEEAPQIFQAVRFSECTFFTSTLVKLGDA